MIWKVLFMAMAAHNVLLVDAQRCTSGSKQDIVFVVDSSGSIRDNNPADGSYDNWSLMLNFISDFIDKMTIGPDATQVGVVTFGNEGNIIFTLNQYGDKGSIQAAVMGIEYKSENTNTSGGIRVMRTQQFTAQAGDRSDADNVAIVITDGKSTYDNEKTIPEAEQARSEGIQMFVIGVTELIEVTELKQMSSMPQELGQNYWTETDFQALNNIIDVLTEATICQTTTTTTTTTTTATTTTTPTPSTPPSEPSCYQGKEDIVFIVDSSGSIRDNNPPDDSYDNWALLLQFIANLARAMDIRPGAVNVGLVVYSNNAKVVFNLNSFTNEQEVIDAILELEYIGGFTNTSGAIRLTHTEMFTAPNGDRPDADNVVIIVTDGYSTLDETFTIPEAEKAREKGIRMYAVGITDVVDIGELRGMSSPPQVLQKNYWTAPDFTVLDEVVDSIINAECGTSTPPTDCLNGNGADIVIMVDTSGSIGFENWSKMVAFLKDLVAELTIGANDYQIGIVPFSDDASVKFHLNQYTEKDDIYAAIDDIYYDEGNTNIAHALETIRTTMFTRRNGDRLNVPNIGILITDGEAKVRPADTIPEANLAKQEGIILMSVGVTNAIVLDQLTAIASSPEYVLTVDDFDTLTSSIATILAIFCKEVTPVTTCPDRPCREEFDCNFEGSILECPCGSGWSSKFCYKEYPEQSNKYCLQTDQRENRPEGYTYAIVDAVCGTRGPRAGGTDVFIWGEGLEDHFNAEINIGSFPCYVLDSEADYFHCITSAGESPNGPLPVEIKLPREPAVIVPEVFNYMPDPVITSVSPVKGILAGGLRITVTGENFDSVQAAIMEVTSEFTPGERDMKSWLFTSLCNIQNNKTMYCQGPSVSVPDNITWGGPRQKRQAIDTGMTIQDANMFNRKDLLQFYIGFKLDGVLAYKRLESVSEDMGELAVYPNPTIYDIPGDDQKLVFRPGWPFDHNELILTGDRLDWAAGLGDYRVLVGESECPLYSLNTTTLVCNPVTDGQPTPSNDEQKYPQIVITVGNLRFTPGVMEYQMNIWEYPEGRWSIIGIIIFLILLTIFIILCVVCRRRRDKEAERRHYRAIAPRITAPDGFVGPACSILDVIEDDLSSKVQEVIYDSRKITMGVVIKKGQFGVVYVGWLLDGPKERRRTSQIQIKATRHSKTPEKMGLITYETIDENTIPKRENIPRIAEVTSFLEEATILKGYSHPNVVPLIGVAIINNLPYVITPLMENSDLRTFLRREDTVITVRGLLKFCKDVALGMSYLADKQFVHTDLAARNCMIARDLQVKISDPGLAYDLYPEDYYVTTPKQRPLPIKWMSPESLDTGVFTTRSDVWSFGVVMWEILTRGRAPYQQTDVLDMRELLHNGRRLKRPETTPDEVHQLMKHCWSGLPEERPQFPFVAGQLEVTLERREYLSDPMYYHLGRTTIGSLQGSIGRASTVSHKSLASSRVYMVGANERYLAAVPESETSVLPEQIDVFVSP